MEMNEKHEAVLKALLVTDELPDVVVTFYNRLKRLADHRDIFITDQVLLMVASIAESMPEIEESPVPVKDEEKPPESIEKTTEIEQPATPEGGLPCAVFYEGREHQGVLLDEQTTEEGMCTVRLIGTTDPIIIEEHNVNLKE